MSFIDWYNQYLIIIKLLCRAYNNASNPSLYPHSHFTPPHKNHLFMSCRYHNEYWIYRTLSCEYILWSKFRITLDGPPLKPFILSKWVGGHLEILVSARVVMICYWLPTCASRIPSIVCYRGIAMRLKETRNVYYKHPQFEFNSLLKGRPSLRYQKVFRGFFIISVGSILFLWNLLWLLLLHLNVNQYPWQEIPSALVWAFLEYLKFNIPQLVFFPSTRPLTLPVQLQTLKKSRRGSLIHSVTFGGSAKLNKSTDSTTPPHGASTQGTSVMDCGSEVVNLTACPSAAVVVHFIAISCDSSNCEQ